VNRTPTFSVVLLTQGNRPKEFRRNVDHVRAQVLPPGHDVEIVVVVQPLSPHQLSAADGSAPSPVEIPDGVTVVELPENLGIPGGRDVGWRATHGDLVVFLDDDGWLPEADSFARVLERFTADPRLGIIAFRIADPITGATARRHVPRLRTADPLRAGEVTAFLGGAWAMRREVLEQTGGLAARFFFAHEETDLAWKTLDRGWRIYYDPAAVLFHPTTSPARHAEYYRTNARNRVWLAKRNLPAPVGVTYLGVWIALTLARVHNPRALRTWFRGFAEGIRTDAGERRVMKWRTVWRMTRLGRPPVI
jgi:GT2 family glycosyltransferase